MNKLIPVTVFILSAFTAFAQTAKNTAKPFILGEIQEMQSTILNEKRTLNIYLPEGYSQDDTTHYPVIYLLDGGADEDFIHVVGIVQFDNFPWINQLPQSIVVGIVNTDRKRDFTYPSTLASDKKLLPTSGGSANFTAFLEKELQPFINKKYRTNTDKMLIGESLGGLLATEILLKKPTLFNKYVIVSPSLWWDNGALLQLSSPVLEASFTQSTGVYIGVGKEGLGPSETPHVMEVDANVLADKIKNTKSKNVAIYFDYLPKENHATIGHQAIFNAFRMLFTPPK